MRIFLTVIIGTPASFPHMGPLHHKSTLQFSSRKETAENENSA